MSMTSSKPYLLRALYEWIVENKCTPYILADAFAENILVPQQYVKDGQIVLNISPTAVVDLQMTDGTISFNARFGGIPTDVCVPVYAVLGIYARENGRGMMFDPEDPPPEPTKAKLEPVEETSKPEESKGDSKDRPSLRIVK